MDLLGAHPALSLLDETWRIYSRHEAAPPQYVGSEATVENSSVTAGCEIYGTVRNSVLGVGVVVEKGAVVEDSVLMNGVRVGEGATVHYSILDANVSLGKNTRVGEDRAKTDQIAVIGADCTIPEGGIVPPGAMLEDAKSN